MMADRSLAGCFVSLHTDNPGTGGAQDRREATYPGYTRMELPPLIDEAAAFRFARNLDFPRGVGDSTELLTHFAVGMDGLIWVSGMIAPRIAPGEGITPRLLAATTISKDSIMWLRE